MAVKNTLKTLKHCGPSSKMSSGFTLTHAAETRSQSLSLVTPPSDKKVRS